MADEQDRLRRQLGLAPLSTASTAPVVDERTQAKAKTFTEDQLEAVRAQIEARDALTAAKQVNVDLAKQLGAKIDSTTGKIDKTTIPKKEVGGKTVVSVTYEGTGKNRIKITKYSDGTETRESAPEEVGGGAPTIVSTYTDSVTGDVIAVYSDGTTKVLSKGTKVADAATTTRTLGKDQFKNSLALFFGAAEAAKPWVDALYDVVSKFYRTGSDVDQSFNLALQDARNNPALKPFTDRFKGIYALQDLKLTGKPVLVPTIAEYVVSQAKMADVLTEANLGSLATDEFTTELISKGNSVTTIAEKIAKVYQRIDMAPKAIKDTLGRYFPTVDRTTLAKTLLTGQKGVDQLVDELEQYEVLAAAEGQGLGAINRIGGVDLGRAQEYARSGQTYASLTPQFSKIARALPTTTKLSQISKVEDIGQVGLEKALISQSAKELEKLQELSEEEEARFAGKAGRAELGLASQRRANRAF